MRRIVRAYTMCLIIYLWMLRRKIRNVYNKIQIITLGDPLKLELYGQLTKASGYKCVIIILLM